MFTTVKGEWDEVMDVVRRAVAAVAEVAPRVSLVLKADVRPGLPTGSTPRWTRSNATCPSRPTSRTTTQAPPRALAPPRRAQHDPRAQHHRVRSTTRTRALATAHTSSTRTITTATCAARPARAQHDPRARPGHRSRERHPRGHDAARAGTTRHTRSHHPPRARHDQHMREHGGSRRGGSEEGRISSTVTPSQPGHALAGSATLWRRGAIRSEAGRSSGASSGVPSRTVRPAGVHGPLSRRSV